MSGKTVPNAICDECLVPGKAEVWWENESGEEVEVEPGDEPLLDDSLTKHVARQCQDCGNYWEYVVE